MGLCIKNLHQKSPITSRAQRRCKNLDFRNADSFTALVVEFSRRACRKVEQKAYINGVVGEIAVAGMKDELEKSRLAAAEALRQCGNKLVEIGELAEALALYNRVISLFDKSTEPALREQVAMALVNSGLVLGQGGARQQEIGVYDDVVSRFGEATEPALREQVTKALVCKAIALIRQGDYQQGIEVCNDAAARLGEATEPTMRELVAMVLSYKAYARVQFAIAKRGDYQQGLEVCNDVVARFGAATEPAIRGLVAKVLVFKAIALRFLGRIDKSVATMRESDRAGTANHAADETPQDAAAADRSDNKNKSRGRVVLPFTPRARPTILQRKELDRLQPILDDNVTLLYDNIIMRDTADITAAARTLSDNGVKDLSDSDLKDVMRVVAVEVERRETMVRAPAEPRPVTAEELFGDVPPTLRARPRQKYKFPPELLDDPQAVSRAQGVANARTYKIRKGIEVSPEEDARGKKADSFVKQAQRRRQRAQPSAG